ncbi:LacI family DNA-binding transcriptional regulator [Anoxybacillus rupiensis]|jgi:LacI family transcriptional regulator, purine nucleotide synthesis repressor|uniref:LacI family DNA-binding transcriptional regulator n=1 Tax=Anoxybacteroides rupiense TaxID=311460 RepID=A0ABT5W2X2_9BACL|nr:LacI family DNA-binding transcriptional regulator [Anoxybacillus rupiensis]MBB3906502.1 DNA-binding LacI/PurR family transcriptional regulator [Anoxybacillus rupiensis]MBS2770818.1 LacI family DNA-binding transcriptional regulator [Anoxybacillus rupiensis]MDE8563673.1 LacI family DNA-binding transcriptional regulator [Anoxybacillus rupiensis]
MKPTIYDVAKKAGVSIATVSKVVNNTGNISDRTRKKVMKVMQELEYQPSSLAAALTGKRTFTIGVLVPDIANPFFAEVARALENYARETGYAMILCSTDYQRKREQDYLELLMKKQVDGIIIATEPKDLSAFRKLQSRHIPFLMFSIDHLALPSHVVTTDDIRGGYLAGRYLLDKGHRRLAIIAELSRPSGRLRLEGFKQALSDQGIELESPFIIDAISKVEDAKLASQKLLHLPEKPTGVFATTDLIAVVFMNEARKLHVQVPGDISVIGFDNTIHAEIADPGLTTIAQPIDDLARYAVYKLLESIEKPEMPGHRIMLAPALVERQSVKDLKDQYS